VAVSALDAAVGLSREDGFHLEAEIRCAAGEVAAVVGPSGAGKTTLLRCLAGLERACRGCIAVGGEVWQESAPRAFLPAHRRAVGVVFQDGALFQHLSVRGNLEYGWRRRRRARGVATDAAGAHEAPDALAAELGIGGLLGRSVDVLSGGERQRVALGRALLAAPSLLLLDEPFAAVDPAGRAGLAAAVLDACRRRSLPVVLVTHSRAEVLRLADTVSVLVNGKVTARGPVGEMTAALAGVPAEPGEDLAALVEATVARHDDADALTYLEWSGGTFAVPRLALSEGARHRLLVQARDVSVAVMAPVGTSILNVYPARVASVDSGADGQPLLRLEVGGAVLLARISRRSLRELAIAPGSALFAQVKAVALA
jgi:molybdate transport system ATP-binding protein